MIRSFDLLLQDSDEVTEHGHRTTNGEQSHLERGGGRHADTAQAKQKGVVSLRDNRTRRRNNAPTARTRWCAISSPRCHCLHLGARSSWRGTTPQHWPAEAQEEDAAALSFPSTATVGRERTTNHKRHQAPISPASTASQERWHSYRSTHPRPAPTTLYWRSPSGDFLTNSDHRSIGKGKKSNRRPQILARDPAVPSRHDSCGDPAYHCML
jgi:hypothetical protein